MANKEDILLLSIERIKQNFKNFLTLTPIGKFDFELESKLKRLRDRFDTCIKSTNSKDLEQVLGERRFETVWAILNKLESFMDTMRRETVQREFEAEAALYTFDFLSKCAKDSFTPRNISKERRLGYFHTLCRVRYQVGMLAFKDKLSDGDSKVALIITLSTWLKDTNKPLPRVPQNIKEELAYLSSTMTPFLNKQMIRKDETQRKVQDIDAWIHNIDQQIFSLEGVFKSIPNLRR